MSDRKKGEGTKTHGLTLAVPGETDEDPVETGEFGEFS
jgi:hypothetical protein